MVYVALHGYGRIAEKTKAQALQEKTNLQRAGTAESGFSAFYRGERSCRHKAAATKYKLSPMLMDACMGQP
jgi:hypothetical protein